MYYDPVELPSLEQIEQIERQRMQAIEALEISGNSVKCQRCSAAVPIVGKVDRPKNDRVVALEKRINWIEAHYHDHHRDKADDLKALFMMRVLPLFVHLCASL